LGGDSLGPINLQLLPQSPMRHLRVDEVSPSSDAQQPMPITVRVREACRLSGIGRSKLYELIAAGEIETIKVGTITLVPVISLTRFLQRKAG
jgi:excisionase family DNA binding protein